MAGEYNVQSVVDYNKHAGKNWVLPNQARSSITDPANGQGVIENGTPYFYDAVKGKWVAWGADGMRIKGTVGTDAAHPEWLSNLPADPSLGDGYYVGTPGSYGPTGDTQKGQIGDLFICIQEAVTTPTPAAAKWTLVPSGNGRFKGTITGDGTTTQFTLAHPLATDELIVAVYDSANNAVLLSTQVSTTNVIFTFASAPAVGTTYTVIVIAG